MRQVLNVIRVYLLVFIIAASTIIYAVYQQVLYVKKDRLDFLHNYSSEDDDYMRLKKEGKVFKNKQMYIRNIYKIKSDIKWINTKQHIVNSYLGPVNNRTYVIVIQCHSSVNYLRELLNSLSKAFFINSALLIFSHDHYSYEMNKLIKTVNYAKYMQIFYPFSMQLHPNVFPGSEPKACVDGFHCVKSNYRDPEAAQSKHHWWWQANQIFDHINVLKNFTDPILFLEDDNYVTTDALVVYRLLIFARNIHCPFCEIISLAAHDPELSLYKRRKSVVTVEVWTDTMPRTAIAFDRNVWKAIKKYKEVFCYFNDSNWDNSLKYLGSTKWEGNIYMTAIGGPRVFRLEKCDDNQIGCHLQYKVDEVKRFIKLISKQLYPFSIKIKVMAEDDFNSTALGYWSDPRDHELCMHFAKQSVWY